MNHRGKAKIWPFWTAALAIALIATIATGQAPMPGPVNIGNFLLADMSNVGGIAHDLLPDATATRNLGSSTFKWQLGYFNGAVAAASFGTIGNNGNFQVGSRAQWLSPADGVAEWVNNAASSFTALYFGGTTATAPAILTTIQTNPYLSVEDAASTHTANLRIPSQKATTGQRYACIDTNGQIVSSATACSGT